MPTRGNFQVDGAIATPSEWWRMAWRQPDPRERQIDWFTAVQLATRGDEVECRLRIRISAHAGVVMDVDATVEPPGIVPQLVEKPGLSATCMNEPVYGTPRDLTGPHVGAFVTERLEYFGRRLPIVMVSVEQETGRALIDAHRLAGRLAGLAEVVSLRDGEASWELTKQIGKIFSCFNGAVRIYWPNLNTKRDNPFDHRLWVPDHIMRQSPRIFIHNLFEHLCMRVGRALEESPIWNEVHRKIQEQQDEESRQQLMRLGVDKEMAEKLLTLVEAGKKDVEADRDEALKMAATTESQLSINENRLKKIERELNDTQKENDQLRIALAAASIPQKEIVDIDPEITSVLEAVQYALDLPNLVFCDSALDSAEESQSNRGPDVYKVLKALNRLAIEYRTGLGKSVNDWIKERVSDVSFDYAHHLSDTTATQREDDHTFGGILMPKHLKFGGGHNTQNQVRVHFEFEFPDDPPRCMIGWCGKHLPNTQT